MMSWFRILALGGLCLILASCSSSDVLDQARKEMDEFKRQTDLALQAQAAEDTAAILLREKEANEALRRARDLFQQGGVLKGDDLDAVKAYAEVLTRLGDFDLMAEALKRATELAPEDPALWGGLGQALSQMGHAQATEARKALDRALELHPEGRTAVGIYSVLGTLYMKENLFDLSREYWTEATKIDASLPGPRIALAALDVRAGKLKEASEALDTLGNIPEFMDVMRLQLTEALDDFEASRTVIPDTAADHLAYAMLLVRINRLPESVWPLERALKLDPNNYVGWNLLGSIRQGLGDTLRARGAFQRSLDIKPDQPRTREALQALDQDSAASPAPGTAGSNPAGPGME